MTASANHRLPAAPGTFLSFLDGSEQASLIATGVALTFERDGALMRQDEPDDRVMLLTRGRVKVTRTEASGRELLTAIRDPGDLIGELGFIDGLPRVASVFALEAVEACVIPRATFRSHLELNAHAAVVLLALVASRVREATLNESRFATSDTMGCLAARLRELADRYGRPERDGVVIEMPISQEELGEWAGASRAGATQALHMMRRLGWIETSRGTVLVRDLEALSERAA